MIIDSLKQHIPSSVLRELPLVINKYGIETNSDVAHFLGQCSHESGGFSHVFENLNYSGESLLKVFPRHFKDVYEAQQFHRRPEEIANRIYGGRMGNGPAPSGDGWKYRGRGFIQLTGRINYAAFDKSVDDDIVANPDYVATKYPLLSAGWFWRSRGIPKTNSTEITDAAVMRITKIVNGGSHGLANRIALTRLFFTILSDAS